MDWILFVVAALFLLVGLGCMILIVFQLPGVWILLALALLIEVFDGWYLTEEPPVTFGWWVLGLGLGLAALGELIEFVAGMMGAKKAGSSRRGMWGALIGGIVGAFLLAVPIPIVGALIGAIVGTFAGAFLAEMTVHEATVRGSVKPAMGASIGRILGTAGKLAVAISVWVILTFVAFVP